MSKRCKYGGADVKSAPPVFLNIFFNMGDFGQFILDI
jgi:hypothetical protein